MPTAVPLRDLELVAGGGLAITGALTVFRATGGAGTGLNMGLLLGAAMTGGGLWLLWDASRRT